VKERGIGTAFVIAIVVVVATAAISGYLLLRGGGITSIADIIKNPGQYMDKQVEVKGMVTVMGYVQPGFGMLTEPETGMFIFLINLPENFTPIAYHRVKGTVTTYTHQSLGTSLAIDVTDIRLAD